MRTCYIASSGGHSEELLRLKNVINSYDNILVTEYRDKVTFEGFNKVIYVPQTNRREWSFLFKMIYLFGISIKTIHKEKPDVLITTGALIAYPFCIIGKLFGKRVIYIESFARVNNLSLTGKLLYKKADLFIVQWEELHKKYPDTVFGGGIF